MIQSAELIYQNFIELARENQECPLCDRGIHGDALKKMLDQVRLSTFWLSGEAKNRVAQLYARLVVRVCRCNRP
jgi:hypothetical protein